MMNPAGIVIPVGAVVIFATYMVWFYNAPLYSIRPSPPYEDPEEGGRGQWRLFFPRRTSLADTSTASNHGPKHPSPAALKDKDANLKTITVHVVKPDGTSCVATNDRA